MDHPHLIVCSFMENSILLKKVKNIIFLSMNVDITLPNSEDPDKMSKNAESR